MLLISYIQDEDYDNDEEDDEEDVDDIMYHYIFRRKMGRLTRDVTVARDISKVNVLLVIVHLMAMVVVIILMIIVVVVMVVMDDVDDGKEQI